MRLQLNKEEFFEKLNIASSFTSTKSSSLPILSGAFIKIEKDRLHLYASNLNSYFHSYLKVEAEKNREFVIEPKKILEFLNLLSSGKVDMEIKEKEIVLVSNKAKGVFAFMDAKDFPLPPKIETEQQKIDAKKLVESLSLVLFSAAADETRPTLTGVNIITNEDMVLVTTDGFRLSLVRTKKIGSLPVLIVPADFFSTTTKFLKAGTSVSFSFSEQDKIILFKTDEYEFYSRIIEGDFPPYEKVIPNETKTTALLDREEFQQNVKIASIFARDYSSVVVVEFKKNEVLVRPKIEGGAENGSAQPAETTGEEQKVAFNYRFLLDFLNHVDSKKITIEVLRSDSPVVFRGDNLPGFFHIIMPVRIQE